MHATFTEKSVWIQLLGVLTAFGAYFVVAWQMLTTGVVAMSAYTELFTIAAIALIVFMIAGHVTAAIASRPGRPTDRDRVIGWHASHLTSRIVTVGALLAVVCLAAGVPNAWTANLILLVIAVSEVVGAGVKIGTYRRQVAAPSSPTEPSVPQ